MTLGKYKRLLLVVTLPLLLLGYLVSWIAMPHRTGTYRLCQGYSDYEKCRNVGKPGEVLYDRTKQQSPVWFQVNSSTMDHAHDFYVVEADPRTVGRVTVDEVVPYNGLIPNPQGAAQMESLKGRPALLRMGIEKGQRSIDAGSEIFLFCHTLDFDMNPTTWVSNPGPYAAQCVADNWGGYISFKPSPEAEQQLVLLRDAVNKEVSERERDYTVDRIVITISFLVLFLVLSAIIWVTRRAAAFVRAG